ncbi:histidine phosphatase family protein [Mycoplasmatota bacterium]|nr:histidine phosphatase family protein [Mycoplasmatota bacterium]
MTKITLVRHGQTDYNKNRIIQGQIDIPLNSLGKEQAVKTSNHFKNESIDLIISSPLIRAYETAQIIANEINYTNDILIDKAFIERNFGQADGKEISLCIEKVHQEEITGLELSSQLKKRMIDGILKVVKENENKNIVIVCHSHSIKAVLSALNPDQYNFKTPLTNCGITLLEHRDNQLTILKASYNDYI